MRIGIIDYGMGNIGSVFHALSTLSKGVVVVEDPADLGLVEKVVLPGVGAFGDGIRQLRSRGWADALGDEILIRHKPFLGICLGMQLLADYGTENGMSRGLGWIRGHVAQLTPGDASHRIPHIGWNDVRFHLKTGLFAGMGDTHTFYFLHSYVLHLDTPEIVSGVCDYGIPFAAGIEIDNIWATQFHPEKSQNAGLAVLRNFTDRT